MNNAIEVKDDSIIINTESNFELLYGYDEMYSLLKNKTYGYTETDIACKYSLYKKEILVGLTINLDFQKKIEIFENANLESKFPIYPYLINKRKRNLNLFSQEEYKMFKILERLNEEEESPLYSRISLYDKVTKGIDCSSLMEGIKNSNVLDYSDNENMRYIVIKTLLWTFVNANINNSESVSVANEIEKRRFYTKTPNVIYVLNLLPYVWDVCIINKVFFTPKNIESMLKQLNECKEFSMDALKSIKNESMAKSLAKKHGEELKHKLTLFDVAEGI